MELGLHFSRLDFYGRGCWHRYLHNRRMAAALVYADSWTSHMTENNGGVTMTREEAIEVLRRLPIGLMDLSCEQKSDLTEALNIALAALRGPTREQVEALRGEWIKRDGYTECSKCEYWYPSGEVEEEDDRTPFCPRCGRPMTDEAVDIVMKRLEALKDGSTN